MRALCPVTFPIVTQERKLRSVPTEIGHEFGYFPMDASTARQITDKWEYPLPYDFYGMTAEPEDYQECVRRCGRRLSPGAAGRLAYQFLFR